MISFMGPFSFGIALSIRLGSTLPISVSRAKQTMMDTFVVSAITFGLLSIIMFVHQDSLIQLFTTSDAIISGCHEIWWNVCVFSFFLAFYGIFMGACFGLGMQWRLGISTFIALWIIGLPSGYYVSVVQYGGINALWTSIWPPYVLLSIALAHAIVNADWDQISIDILIREGLVEMRDNGQLAPSSSVEKTNVKLILLPKHIHDTTYGSI